ncbi:MAG TPA: DUF362 domain-containing protein [Bacteroidales bacterium]|nr:DUF362 domain-containing protein [Bacteroidales bacterium]
MQSRRFDISKLKGKLGRIRDWMINHHLPPKVLIILMGIISTIWFLIRVIPKPSRATYPCMRVAAPFMSGFVAYLLAVAGFTSISRISKRKILNVRYAATFMLVLGVVVAMAVAPQSSQTQKEKVPVKLGPDDGPNQPMGKAMGIYPGRVVWIWNPDATNEKFEHNDYDNYNFYCSTQNNNPAVISKMFQDGMLKLTGKKNIKKSWESVFRYFNTKKFNKDKGYTKGEKIFIKINQGQSRWVLNQADKDNGFYIPKNLTDSQADKRRKADMIPTENGPYVVLELLRELINEVGVAQEDISIGDPMCPIWGHNYEVWAKEFPNVKYIDKNTTKFGRTQIKLTEAEVLFYSDKKTKDKLYDVTVNANYLINLTTLKAHGAAGISLTAKSHFGNVGRGTANHLHYSHIAARREGTPDNAGYKKYRVFVDLMGSKYLGQNTLIWLVDGLFGGGSSEIKGPVKYLMAPFNNDWSSSIFMSLDPVAIESVGYDFLREEWNGQRTHDAVNNDWESMAATNGVDDYMHQAADPANWPEGIKYDPDNSGSLVPVLGVHEHWNNPVDKQYSRNLGKGNGIELVSIPENLVKQSRN